MRRVAQCYFLFYNLQPEVKHGWQSEESSRGADGKTTAFCLGEPFDLGNYNHWRKGQNTRDGTPQICRPITLINPQIMYAGKTIKATQLKLKDLNHNQSY